MRITSTTSMGQDGGEVASVERRRADVGDTARLASDDGTSRVPTSAYVPPPNAVDGRRSGRRRSHLAKLLGRGGGRGSVAVAVAVAGGAARLLASAVDDLEHARRADGL